MIATHLGVVDEDRINNMSFPFFEDVLDELGHKLHYDAVVNYAGNSFMEKSWALIIEYSPFHVQENNKHRGGMAPGLAGFLAKGNINILGGS